MNTLRTPEFIGRIVLLVHLPNRLGPTLSYTFNYNVCINVYPSTIQIGYLPLYFKHYVYVGVNHAHD